MGHEVNQELFRKSLSELYPDPIVEIPFPFNVLSFVPMLVGKFKLCLCDSQGHIVHDYVTNSNTIAVILF